MDTNEHELKAEARRLRERIYGPISDEGWEKLASFWVKDIGWLRTTVARDHEKKGHSGTEV